MDYKKTEESAIIELFRDLYVDFPKGILNASESPDFILSIGPRKKIGIELTRLHPQSPGENPFSFEGISACLDQKEEKLPLYRKKRLQEYWLIITVRDPAYIPGFNLHNKLENWKFESSYNRLIIFNVIEGDIFELKKQDR